MIYLFIAISCSAMISIFIRLSQNFIKNEMVMYVSNYSVCCLLALVFMEDFSALPMLLEEGGRVSLGLSIITGALYLINLAFMKMTIARRGIVMSSTFSKLGVVVSILIAVVVFHEMPTPAQIIGILISIGAILLINLEKGSQAEGKGIGWLLGLLVLTGVTNSMTSIFEQMGDPALSDGYLFGTFGTALLLAFVVHLIKKEKTNGYDFLFGVLIGVPNYFSSRFLLLALTQVEAVLVYPIYSVATLVIVTLAGLFFFKEKTSKRKMVALGLIVLALVLLNI